MAANTKTTRNDGPFDGFELRKALDGMMRAFNYEKPADTPRKRNDMESAPAQTDDRRKSR